MITRTGLPRPSRLQIAATVAGGAAILATRATAVASWTAADVAGFVALAAAIVVAEQFPAPIRYGDETENLSFTDALFVLGLLLAPVSVVLLAVAVAVTGGQLLRGWAPHKVAFNVGQDLVGISLASLVYGLWGAPADPLHPSTWGAAAAAMAAYAAFNEVSMATLIASLERMPLRTVLAAPLGFTALQWSVNLAGGIAAAVAWSSEPALLPLAVVPVLIVHRLGGSRSGATAVA